MVEIFKVNAWRVYQTEYGYEIKNLDRGSRCKWFRESNRYTYTSGKFKVPVTIERLIAARESFSQTTELSNRTFGIEIECYHPTNRNIREEAGRAIEQAGVRCRVLGYTHEVLSSWKITTDSSIRGGYGLEVVSPILSGEAGLEEVTKVVRVLSSLGCRVNRSTGLHVHHGARDLSREGILNVFKFYRENELLFDSLVAPSRRDNNNSYCASLRFQRDELPSSRYTKLNYQAYAKYGTIEVRHHQGTLNADKITHWVRLTQKLIERASRATRRFSSLEEMLSFLGLSEMANWYLERESELSA